MGVRSWGLGYRCGVRVGVRVEVGLWVRVGFWVRVEVGLGVG